MEPLLELVLHQCIDGTVPSDLRLSFESLRHNLDEKVCGGSEPRETLAVLNIRTSFAIPTALCDHGCVVCVLGRVIADVENAGREMLRELLSNGRFDGHPVRRSGEATGCSIRCVLRNKSGAQTQHGQHRRQRGRNGEEASCKTTSAHVTR